MSQPWMHLYVADYLADTSHLGVLEHGGYLLLIMHYWRVGSLPHDDVALARIARMTPREWAKSKDVILAFFDADLRHKRIDKELIDARESYERRARAGSKGGKGKALKNNDAPLAVPEQCSSDDAPLLK